MKKNIKIIFYLFSPLFLLLSLNNSNIFASDISDCLALERLKAKNEEVSSQQSQEIATKICGIRARLGFTTENAREFNSCMNNERIKDENSQISYLELVENSIEICNNQIEAKKSIEIEIEKQKEEKYKEEIKQKKLENKKIKAEKELEEERYRIKKRKDYDDYYYVGHSGWFLGTGLGFATIKVKFPKVSQDLFGDTDAFEGNEFEYSGANFSVILGKKKEKTRTYFSFDFVGGGYTGGIEQDGNHDYTNLTSTDYTFIFDYFVNINNSEHHLFFIGGGYKSFNASLALSDCNSQQRARENDPCLAYWYRESDVIYLDDEIEISGSFPVVRIGWHWGYDGKGYAGHNIELSYTRHLGSAKGSGTFSIISGSGLSNNPNAHGPYRGEFEIPPFGVFAFVYNVYF